MHISENSSFSSTEDPNKINNTDKNTNLEDLDGIPIVYQVNMFHLVITYYLNARYLNLKI